MTRFGSVALAAACVSIAGCTVDRDVALFIEGGGPGLVYELRVYESPTCATVSDRIRLESATTDGSVHSQIFRQGGGQPVGALASEPHCFVVLARDTTCAPVAFGTELADLASGDTVTVALAPTSGAATCGPARTCSDGACLDAPPAADGGPDAFVPCTPDDGTTCGVDPASMCCSGRCVSTSTDALNCGACGASCRDETGGMMDSCCGGVCVDLTSDELNCGACGARCDTTCSGGVCGMGGAEILIQLEPRTMLTTVVVEVTWFQWDGRDPDPPEMSGYSTPAKTSDGSTEVRIPIASIRPPEETLYLCERTCADEATCPCDSSGGSAGIAFGWIVATDVERAALLGRAQVVVLYVPVDGLDPSMLGDALGVSFADLPRPGITVYSLTTDTTLVPVPAGMPIELLVCDLPATDECTREPVTRPYP